MHMRTTLLVILFLTLFGGRGVFGARNITVDNTDTSITYTGLWAVTSLGGYDYNGTQNLVDLGDNLDGPGGDSTATFVFTGIAVYYMSPLWPYRVDTVLTLDNDPSVVVNMTAPGQLVPIGSTGATVVSSVLWGRTGLNNTQHKLVMSRAPGGRYVVVDALIYTEDTLAITTVPSPQSSASASTQTSASAASSSSSPSASANEKRITTLVAVASSLASIIGLTIVAVIIFFIVRARRRRKPQDPATVVNPSLSPFPPHVTQVSSPSDKGSRMYGHLSMPNTASRTAGSDPLSSIPRALHADSASIAPSAGPPPYQ